MTNTGVVYYFINDFNQICKQETGIDKDFAEVINIQDLIDDINCFAEENKQLRDNYKSYKKLIDENEELKQEYDLVCRFIRRNHDVTMIHKILKEGGIV